MPQLNAQASTDSGWGYINRQGEFIIKPQFDSACGFYEKLAEIESGYKVGFINKKGEMVIKPFLDSTGFFKDGVSIGEVNKKFVIITLDGDIIFLNNGIDFIDDFSDGLAAIYINHKIGYANKKGEIVIEPQFYDANEFSEGLACVRL